MLDIYFEDNYGRLYEKKPSEIFEKFVLKNEYGCVTNKFIKRIIPIQLNDSQDKFYDIITPYGYGGPIIESLNSPSYKEKLIESYNKAFRNYADDNNIVSEFVRFHPIVRNAEDFNSIYQIKVDRTTFGTDLTQNDPIAYDFSNSAKKKINKLLKKYPIHYVYDEHPKNLNDFKKIYYSTMDRKSAMAEYYFDDEYFNKLIEYFPDNLVTVKIFLDSNEKSELIGMGLYFRYGKYLHTHLSGTLTEFLKFSPAYILKQAFLEYGKENGYSIIHYGGGKTSSTEDSLREFKERFGQRTQFNFCLGTKIWNQEKYDEFCTVMGTTKENDFFPAYRKKNRED